VGFKILDLSVKTFHFLILRPSGIALQKVTFIAKAQTALKVRAPPLHGMTLEVWKHLATFFRTSKI
jgi:hypothetical protein